MATPQLKWPAEAESQRKNALGAATQAIQFLQEAQKKADLARQKIYLNTGVATILLAEAVRLNADAQTKLEQILLSLSLAKAAPLKGRWGVGVATKRENSELAAKTAGTFVSKVITNLEQAQEKVNRNPELSETIISRTNQWQAQAISHIARIERLLTEAGIGRDSTPSGGSSGETPAESPPETPGG